jgi:hypothetical protein
MREVAGVALQFGKDPVTPLGPDPVDGVSKEG